MKAGVVAFTAASLAGSAFAVPGDYGAWPASSSSSAEAAAVKPTESCDEDTYDPTSSSSAAWPEWTASSSSSSSAAGYWGKASSSSSTFTTSSAGWWPSAVADPVAPAWTSSIPAWFDPSSAYACCKTVVTETVYGSSMSTPTQADPRWLERSRG